jgi:hypothetical protein
LPLEETKQKNIFFRISAIFILQKWKACNSASKSGNEVWVYKATNLIYCTFKGIDQREKRWAESGTI